MRPIRLELQAFGSYPGKEVVDFDVLGRRGLFLVTGPTGSGKTTVFDAMVFALYGKLPGSRSVGTKAPDCRSHFAAAGVETYVQFVFEVDGTRYSVRRTPAQLRPKLKGSGTTEAGPTASVVRHSPSGDEPLATKADDAARVCGDLLGIDAGQFQRVVLLPQGRFSDFLVAGDDDREKLLRPLFGTEIYKRATEMLLETVKQLGGQVESVSTRAAHHRQNAREHLVTARRLWLGDEYGTVDAEATDDDVRSMIDELEPEQRRRSAHLDVLQAALQKATEARTEAQGAQRRFDDAAQHSATLERLESEREAVEAGGRLAAASAVARPVVAAASAVETAQSRVDAAESRRDLAEAEVRDGFERLGVPMPEFGPATVAAAVQDAVRVIDDQRTVLDAAAKAETKAANAERDLEEATTAHVSALREQAVVARRADELQARIEWLQPRAARLEVLESELRAAETRLTLRHRLGDEFGAMLDAMEAQLVADRNLEHLMARFIATQAPRLAEQLVAGEPCAVCGATEHPSPARHLDGAVVDFAEVEQAQRRQAEAAAAWATVGGSIDQLQQQLGDEANESIEYFEQAIERAREARNEAMDAGARLSEALAEQQSLLGQTAAAQTAVEEARSIVDTLTGTSASLREEAGRLAEVVAGIDPASVAQRASVVDELSAVADELTGVFGELVAAREALGSARTSLDDTLAGSAFASIDEAAAAVLPVDDEERRSATVVAWRSAHVMASVALATLRDQGIPDERPDVAALEDLERAASSAVSVTRTEYTTAANALTSADNELRAAAAVVADAADLQRRYDTARTVHRTCNGEGSLKVKMERWVLSAELGRVTDAANVHLARMTNHRYALQRDESKGGLGLVVSDSHTGTTRATTSLSGGEQFQASLALALGLADVVSMGGTGTGRTFEALFVDEGFGSLDPEALDQAIDALGHLHATGRMVGAITHVEAMKQSLHVGIEVRRLADGGSTLVVHP